MAYPVVSTAWNDYQNVGIARKYEEEMAKVETPDMLVDVRRRAEEYNAYLDMAGHHYRQEDPADPEYQDYLSQWCEPGNTGAAFSKSPDPAHRGLFRRSSKIRWH